MLAPPCYNTYPSSCWLLVILLTSQGEPEAVSFFFFSKLAYIRKLPEHGSSGYESCCRPDVGPGTNV